MHRRSGLCMVVRETMREGDEGDDTLRRGHRLVLSDFHYLQRIDRSSAITEPAVKYRLPKVTIRASEIGTSHFFSERRFVAGPKGTIRLEEGLPSILSDFRYLQRIDRSSPITEPCPDVRQN